MSQPETGVDVIVVGSGVAGASTALKVAAAGRRVALVTKAALGASTTEWAQGGIAAVLDDTDDSTALHLADTITSGAGLCDAEAAAVLVDGAASAIEELARIGAVFDREAGGDLARSLEGGHSRPRVIHAGGAATGAEVARSLVAALAASPVACFERHFARDLVVEDGRCVGVTAWGPQGDDLVLEAPAVVLATGGAGQLFAVTTNPSEATGDGVAMALRAGVAVADLEFVQFHPTALAIDRFPRPLISEALRGAGAVLLGSSGERFTDELGRRDAVSQAIARQLTGGADHVDLDATGIPNFAVRYPVLAEILASAGLDASRDRIPVAPAAHYACGGVLTDLDGATSLPGCYAVGEVACSGVHGANRLASNSLLEGLVFGSRAADAVLAGNAGPRPRGALGALLDARRGAEIARCAAPSVPVPAGEAASTTASRRRLQLAMSSHAGVVRSAESLDALDGELGRLGAPTPDAGIAGAELANLMAMAAAVSASTRWRVESRGAHFRADFPERDDEFERRLVHVRCAHSNLSAMAMRR